MCILLSIVLLLYVLYPILAAACTSLWTPSAIAEHVRHTALRCVCSPYQSFENLKCPRQISLFWARQVRLVAFLSLLKVIKRRRARIHRASDNSLSCQSPQELVVHFCHRWSFKIETKRPLLRALSYRARLRCYCGYHRRRASRRGHTKHKSCHQHLRAILGAWDPDSEVCSSI